MASKNRHRSGADWEEAYGYARAVRVDRRILVSGTVSVDEDGEVGPVDDPHGQAVDALETIADAIEALGGGIEDVVRTRIYVTDVDNHEAVGRAHAEVLGDVRPVTSMVEVSSLIDPDALVEIEAEAVVGE